MISPSAVPLAGAVLTMMPAIRAGNGRLKRLPYSLVAPALFQVSVLFVDVYGKVPYKNPKVPSAKVMTQLGTPLADA